MSGFAPIASAVVVSAAQAWNAESVRQSLTTALLPGLTAGRLCAGWNKRQAAAGEYFALNGAVALYAAVQGKQLILSNDAGLLERIVARQGKSVQEASKHGVTYAAVFRHTQEREKYRALMTRFDRTGHRGRSDGQPIVTGGESPAFFSGNVASLSRVFSKMAIESVQEKDDGEKVTETVTYQWDR